MGKPTGFMEYQRKTGNTIAPLERIKNFKEFHLQLPKKEQQMQAARCMACGVPFCQSGQMLMGMASGGNHDCGNGLRLSAAEPRSGVE